MLAKEEAFIARFKARASHAAQVQSRVKKLEKIEKVEPPRRRRVVTFEFPKPPRSGDDVCKLAHVDKGYGARRIYTDFDFVIRRRERWCVMGVNGAGKSTLLRLIAGEAAPDAGPVALGGSVKLGYFAQHTMDLLDPSRTVIETLEIAHPHASFGSLRTLAGAFVSRRRREGRARHLRSGASHGEPCLRARRHWVLDEMTNHLDLATGTCGAPSPTSTAVIFVRDYPCPQPLQPRPRDRRRRGRSNTEGYIVRDGHRYSPRIHWRC
jgi:ATPase subunit of ABC transporter with duplicated ATPase domains